VIVVEPVEGAMPRGKAGKEKFVAELTFVGERHALTRDIRDFLFHPALPVDIRHNAKIFREKLAPWAAKRLGTVPIFVEQELGRSPSDSKL
jgi:hypothetical protein